MWAQRPEFGRAVHGLGHRYLDAELIKLVRLAFAAAFDLWREDGVDLLTALSVLLIMPTLDEIQLWAEDFVEKQIVCNLTSDFADDSAEIGLEAARAWTVWRARITEVSSTPACLDLDSTAATLTHVSWRACQYLGRHRVGSRERPRTILAHERKITPRGRLRRHPGPHIA